MPALMRVTQRDLKTKKRAIADAKCIATVIDK
jgi:hypothetical protein